MTLNKTMVYLPPIWLLVTVLSLTTLSTYAQQNNSEQLKQAISLRKQGDYDQAVSILSVLRKHYSDHKRINIELVLNYIRLKQYDYAEQILHHVRALELSKKEQMTLSKLNQLLEKKLRKGLSVHSFSLDIGAAYGVDIASNIYPVFIYDDFEFDEEYWYEDDSFDDFYFEQDYDVYEYTNVELIANREEVKEETESNYYRQFVNFDYRYRPTEQFQLFDSPTQWIFDGELTIDHRKFNNVNDKNYLNYQIDTSLYLIQINRWMVEVNLKSNLYESNARKVMSKIETGVTTTIPFEQLKVKLAWNFQNKSYKKQLSEYNADVSIPNAEVSYSFLEQFKVIAGIKYRQLDADDEYHSYDNTNTYIGIHYFPRSNFSAYITYHNNRLRYHIDDIELVNWSKERNSSIAFGAKYQASAQWSLSLNGNIGNHTIELDYGEDNWKRLDVSVVYRF